MVPSERNDRYFAKHGYGFGSVGGCSVAALRSLSIEQLNAVCSMILLGDVEEMGIDEDTCGCWAKGIIEDITYPEGVRCGTHDHIPAAEAKAEILAALVYLSGHLAEDIPILQEPGEQGGN